jgi:hypothetical protein
MMTWDSLQRYRLAQEQAVLRQEYPGFSFYDPQGATYVSGRWVSNSGRPFSLRVSLPSGYPDECPASYITSPSPLRGYFSRIESYGTSHDMHTWVTDRPGWVKICTYHPEHWSAAHSIAKVVRKGQLWMLAYECHLQDGRPIADFLMSVSNL